MTSCEQGIRPKANASDRPQGIGLRHAFANASINEAVLEFIKFDFQMFGRIGTEVSAKTDIPVHVHPFEVNRIDRVFLALEPIARDFRDRKSTRLNSSHMSISYA